MTRHSTYTQVWKRACPACSGNLVRTPRRLLDRLWSRLVPVYRYRCESFSCQWVGNFRSYVERDGQRRTPAKSHALSTGLAEKPAQRDVPPSFVVHMALALVGTVFVLLYTTTDMLADHDPQKAEVRHEEWLVEARLSDQGVALKPQAQQRAEVTAAAAPTPR